MRIRPAATTTLFVAVLTGLVLAPGFASPAASKTKPCPVRVQDDWLDDGVINGTYSVRCLQQALENVPEDLRDYSNITDAINAAIQGALRGPGNGSGNPGDGQGFGSDPDAGKNRTPQIAPPKSYYRRAIDSLGTTSADSLPIPLLVLAGLGTALLLTAAGLAAHKRLRARSLKPQPPAEP
jgi:hypothetical protein